MNLNQPLSPRQLSHVIDIWVSKDETQGPTPVLVVCYMEHNQAPSIQFPSSSWLHELVSKWTEPMDCHK